VTAVVAAGPAGPAPAAAQVAALPRLRRWAALAGVPGLRLPWTGRYLASRLATAVLAVWAVLTIVFLAMHASGDPAAFLVSASAGTEQVERVSALMGFDRPLGVQYLVFLGNAATGQFPDSFQYRTNPFPIVLDRLPATLVLGGLGLGIGAVVGLLLGHLAASPRRQRVGRAALSVSTALEAVPAFLLGLVLIWVFAVHLGVLPPSGSGTWRTAVMPVTVMVVATVPAVARVYRTAAVDAWEQDHVRTARAVGASGRTVAWRHVGLNALAPALSVLGVSAGVMFGGAIVTETLFGWPGVGQLSVSAVTAYDIPLVLACVTVTATGFVLASLLVDLAAAALDPRSTRGRR
jgi:peptide/nickel transport system permease protein